MGGLNIRLLGRFSIARGSGPELRFTPTAQTLLAYLLLHQSFSPRDVLACLCWCNQPDAQARSCLNTALWRLRRVLEPGGDDESAGYLLTTPAGEVGFNWQSDHWLDLEVLERTASRFLALPYETLGPEDARRAESGLSLYAGDLLEGFYDDWALRERERVRCLYLDTLGRLMHYYGGREEWAAGLTAGSKILALDPLREEIHREMMRLYVGSGDRALAVRQYRACREVLMQELSIPPMAETEALYEQVVSGASPDSVTVRAPLLLTLKGSQVAHPAAGASPADALRELREAIELLEVARDRLRVALQTLERGDPTA